jgi:restriction endonuclease S subunit
MTNTLTNHDVEGMVLPGEWRRIPLDELVTLSTASGVPEDDPTLPFVGMEHVARDTGEVVDSGDPISYSSAASIVQPGQVLYGRLRPYLNKVFVPTEPVYASREFIPIVVGPEILSAFLAYRLRSADFVEFAVSLNAGDRPRVKWPQMNAFVLGLPPLEEQERIVEILEDQLSRLDTALQSVQAVREKAAQFRRSLLHAAFTGALTGHDVEDGELPDGWNSTTLDQVVEFRNGYAFKSEWYTEDGVRVVRGQNVSHGFVDWSDERRVSPERASEYQRFELNAGDLLLALDRPLISTGLKWAVLSDDDVPSLLLQRVGRITPDESVLSKTFLHLWVQSPIFISGINPGRSLGIPHISTKELEGLTLHIPPLDEQERIVTILDEQLSRLDASLAVADEVEERSAALRRSLLHSAFTGHLTEGWREDVNV